MIWVRVLLLAPSVRDRCFARLEKAADGMDVDMAQADLSRFIQSSP